MKKKIIALSLATLLCSSLVLASGCAENEEKGTLAKVWSAYSTEKYMQSYMEGHEKLSQMGKTEAKLDFVGMRGETQAMQLMISANEYIKGFDLDSVDLKMEDGTVLSKENIDVYAEKYIEVYDTYLNSANIGRYYSDAGFYPDALVPIDAYKARREDRVRAGEHQGIWVDVKIPRTAKAGEYFGTFTLTLAEQTMDIPVTLKVYDLDMPEEVHSRSHMAIWYTQIMLGEGDNFDSDTYKTYYDFLLDRRLCSGEVVTDYRVNLDTCFEHFCELSKDPRVTCMLIPNTLIPNFSNINKIYDDETVVPLSVQLETREKIKNGLIKVLTTLVEKNFVKREAGDETIDILKDTMFYYEDEPTMGIRVNRVKIFCSLLHQAKQQVLQAKAVEFEKYPDLKASFENIQEICPCGYVGTDENDLYGEDSQQLGVTNYDVMDGVTTWCPQQLVWRHTDKRAIIQKRQEAGEKFWWYNCVSNSPVLSYYIESMPMSIRSSSWMQYEYGVEGILYWEMVHWQSLTDPYKDLTYGSFSSGGEGILLYPGARYGLKTPVSSIRLEQIFHGQQDYEYLYMLDEYMKANEIQATAKDICKKVGENLYKIAYFKEDASDSLFAEQRIQILDILQDFADEKVSDATSKINKILN